jgi:radical SAM protein with 4Fe4S-binding SPASM domain
LHKETDGLKRDGSVEGTLPWRFLRLIAGNPRHLQTWVRAEYRRRVGIPRERRQRGARVAPPINISINLTRRCNLRCAMCIQHRHDAAESRLTWYDPDRELPVAEWVRLLDQVARYRPTLYVTGGEPTLHAGFPEFIRAAKQRGLFVQVATNGLSLGRHAELLVEHGVEVVTVSLDGAAETHDAIRRLPGAFEQTVAGIRALISMRRDRHRPVPVVGLNFTISEANRAEMAAMVPLAAELGVDFFQFQHTIFDSPEHVAQHNRLFNPEFAACRGIDMVAPSVPPGEFYESAITKEHLPAIAKALEGAPRQAAGRLRLSVLPNLPVALLAPYYRDLEHPFGGQCEALWKTLRILPDGTVSPCLHVVAGNIREQSVDEIWNGSTLRHFRALIATTLLAGCARCCNRTFCQP